MWNRKEIILVIWYLKPQKRNIIDKDQCIQNQLE